MKYLIICFLLVFLACSSSKMAVQDEQKNISAKEISNDSDNKIFYDTNYMKLKEKYEKQPDSIKSALYYKNGSTASLFLSEKSKKMIRTSGGMRSVLQQCLTKDNFTHVQNMTTVKYDFIMTSNKTSTILAGGVAIFQYGGGSPIILSQEEGAKLLYFGKKLTFEYNGFCEGTYLMMFKYALPAKATFE